MKKNLCVLFTFTFETAKWITLYVVGEQVPETHLVTLVAHVVGVLVHGVRGGIVVEPRARS